MLCYTEEEVHEGHACDFYVLSVGFAGGVPYLVLYGVVQCCRCVDLRGKRIRISYTPTTLVNYLKVQRAWLNSFSLSVSSHS